MGFANHGEGGMTAKVSILGSHYSDLGRAAVHRSLLEAGQKCAGFGGYVCVANVHTTMMGFFNREYREITNTAFLAVPDGMPLVWAMRSLGAPDQDRVRGPSLMRDLFDKGRASGLKHYLYGGSPEALEMLRAELLRIYPGVLIVGAESPPFRPLHEIPDADWAASAARINESGAQLVWVGLGAPKQELWMFRQRNAVRGVMLGVGAAFDLIPGIVPEAPSFLQAFGLEWAYRLFREPRRLWRRYVFNNPAFLLLWLLQMLRFQLGAKFRIEPRR